MKLVLAVFLLVCTVSAAPKFRNLYKQISKANPRIVGGQEATPNSIPYQAFLEIYDEGSGWYCGGTLISENYVLTAANCGDGGRRAVVTLGAHKIFEIENSQQRIDSNDILVHPNYDGNIENDIAIIRLSVSVKFGPFIEAISLPSQSNENDFIGDLATVSGWGSDAADDPAMSDVLKFLQLRVISNEDCEAVYGVLPQSNICALGANGTGACFGDSGGPLVTRGVLIGIVSFFASDCIANIPSGYTRISSYLEWLEENTDAVIRP